MTQKQYIIIIGDTHVLLEAEVFQDITPTRFNAAKASRFEMYEDGVFRQSVEIYGPHEVEVQ